MTPIWFSVFQDICPNTYISDAMLASVMLIEIVLWKAIRTIIGTIVIIEVGERIESK
jgi:hypothetical protein